MIYLLGRTKPNYDGVRQLFPDDQVPPNDPFALLENRELHDYWTIGFHFSALLLGEVLASGVGRVTYEAEYFTVSANVPEWHTLVKNFLADKSVHIRKFGTALVQTIPELFKNLSRSLNSDGTLVLR